MKKVCGRGDLRAKPTLNRPPRTHGQTSIRYQLAKIDYCAVTQKPETCMNKSHVPAI